MGLVSLGKGRNLKIIFVLLAVFSLFFGLNKFRHSRNKASPKQKTSSSQISYPAKTKTSAVTTTKGQTSQVPAIAPKEIPSVIRLGAYAREDCWILLKADGRVVFQNILKKGRSENWQADQKIEFSLGNAGVVDLEVNGKRMPVLGRRGQVIKNIVITKEEGLRVP